MTSSFDSTGITLDRYADIKTRLETLAKAQWGESVNLDEDQLLGWLINTVSLLLGEINEIVQDDYDSGSVANSTGAKLDNLLELIGIERQAAAYSTATLTLTATAATTVPAGTQYKTAAGVVFATDEALVFTAAGSDDVDATCTIVGANEAAIGEINTIVNSVYGISTVTNAAAATPGRAREEDSELKVRHTNAVATSGEQDAASIFEAVSEVTGVSATYVYDNDTASVAADGTPAYSIHVSVIGGAAADIGAAIANNKVAGTPTYGSQTVEVWDSTTKQAKDINYDIAVAVPLYIDIEGTSQSGIWPDDGEDQMRAALTDLIDDLQIGDDLIFNSLYAAIYAIPGFVCTSLKVDTADPPTGTSDITATALQRLTLDEDDIDITVT